MHAFLTLAITLVAPALVAPWRLGFEREIDTTKHNQLSKPFDFVLTEDYLNSRRNKGKLVTKLNRDEALAVDNVILESNEVRIVSPTKRKESNNGEGLVRQRRGYNLEHVRVPARYPYLPVAKFNRFRRWGH